MKFKEIGLRGGVRPDASYLYPAMFIKPLPVHWLVSRKNPSLQVAQSVEVGPVQVKHDVSQAVTVTQNVKIDLNGLKILKLN